MDSLYPRTLSNLITFFITNFLDDRKPNKPGHFKASCDEKTGDVILTWLPPMSMGRTRRTRAEKYLVEQLNVEDNGNWNIIGITSETRLTVKGLEVDKIKNFRIFSINSSGVSHEATNLNYQHCLHQQKSKFLFCFLKYHD